MNKRDQWYFLSFRQLWRMAGQNTHYGVAGAYSRYQEITESGKSASIYLSDFHGFRIIDESDPVDREAGLSLKYSSKPYPVSE